jgi:carbon-monoxide dehydrogenase iron sulfur subunit
VEKAGKGSVPLQCRHCEEAPCVLICPTKAIKKTGVEEPVIIDSSLCIGCKFCVQVCPFGVVFLDSQGKGIIKCDLCLEKLKKDKLPVCVESCPTGAIEFKLPSELSAELRKKIGKDLVAIIG